LAEHPLSITIQPDHTAVTLAVAGEIDMATVGTLRACLNDLDGSYTRVVIDLTDVTFMDSSGLGLIAGTAQRFGPEGREVIITNPCGHVQRLLEVSGLDHIVRVLDQPSQPDVTSV
jgi:anti-sigma B factor antagonist